MVCWREFSTILLFLEMVTDDTIKIAPDEITCNNAQIENKYFASSCHIEINRHAKIIESICHTVGETAHDEQRYTKQKREVLSLAGKGDCCGLYHTASDGQYSAIERPCGKTCFKYLMCRILQRHGTCACNKSHYEASYYITK